MTRHGIVMNGGLHCGGVENLLSDDRMQAVDVSDEDALLRDRIATDDRCEPAVSARLPEIAPELQPS